MSPQRHPPRQLINDVGDRRAEYLALLHDVLWPGTELAWGRRGDSTRPPVWEYVLVPSRAAPKLLVSAGAPRAAATAVLRSGEATSRPARLKRVGAAAAFRLGLGERLLDGRLRVLPPRDRRPQDTIEDYLHAALERERAGEPLALCVQIGPARANRKPVIHVVTTGGATVGFAKMAVNGLTGALVAAERTALERLARATLTDVMAPRLLHSGTWNGRDITVQSTLPVWRRRVADPARVTRAMREVATLDGVTAEAVHSSAYVTRLHAAVADLRDDSVRRALLEAMDEVLSRHGERRLDFGNWHGDWTAWNMAATQQGVLLWDWERFSGGVPVGFDALHYSLQNGIVVDGIDPEAAVHRLLADSAAVLGAFDVPADLAPGVALLYLTEIAARYSSDGQAEAGAALGVLGRWLLPAITGHLAKSGR